MKWKFDERVAAEYNNIVNKNIPNYNEVIDKCMTLISTYPKDASIVDVGCANGQTLKKISDLGYYNITGVDNSIDMVSELNDFTVIVSDTFPDLKFDIILCNWVLHFITDPGERAQYIKKAYDQLNPGGCLVISDKIDTGMVYFYHLWKYKQGLTLDEINHKADQIDGVLVDLPLKWYEGIFDTLEIEYNIIDSHWCFTTFVITKP